MNAAVDIDRSRREFLKNAGRVAATSTILSAASYPVHAAEDNTIRVALVGCGGRGTGAAANAMATKTAPIKLVAMADIFADRIERSYKGLIDSASAPQTKGSADRWIKGFQADQIDVPPERQFLGFRCVPKGH